MNRKKIRLVFVAFAIILLLVILLQPTLVYKQRYNSALAENCSIHFQTSTRISSLGVRKSVGNPYTLIIISNEKLKHEHLKKVEISSLDDESNFFRIFGQTSITEINGGYSLRDIDLPNHDITLNVLFETETCKNTATVTQEKSFSFRRFSA